MRVHAALCINPSSHHSPDNDDLGAQGSTDSENGHQTEGEDYEVNAEEDFTCIEQLSL